MNIITIRASSLGELFDCPARWEAKQLLGMRMPSSGPAQLGTAIHASTAVFDSSVLAGSGITIEESAAAAVDSLHHPEFEVDWEDSSPSDVEPIALALHKKYCGEVAPLHKYAAVEVKCESLEITDLGIALTGTTDRVRETANGFGIADLKTGKTVVGSDGTVKTQGHTFQLGVYELLAERASGIAITEPALIIGMQTGKTAVAQRMGNAEILGARDVLVGDGETPGVLETAAKMLHGGVFYGNPKSMMCSRRYCPRFDRCNFRK